MEFTQDFIKQNNLTPEQVGAITNVVKEHVEGVSSEWAKKANDNAEGIISGAAKKVEELTGIRREQGQKIAEYLSFASEKFFEGTKASLQRKQAELDEIIKNGAGDETIKRELSETKEALAKLKQKEATFAEWEENDYKGKFQEASTKLTAMQKTIAFNGVKPVFPDTVNEYEAKAKWNEFVKEVEDKNNIVLDDEGTAWAVDKENDFKKTRLKDLVAKNKTVTELLQKREVRGTGADPKALIDIEGLPFKLPVNATALERQTAIKDYLASQNIDKLSPAYAKAFEELNRKAMEKNPTK